MILLFEWDKNKNAINQKKHHISFKEASSVFYDDFAKVIFDPDHQKNEERFIILGLSFKLRLLLVCYCYRNDETIRIVTARKATRSESKMY